MGFKLGTSNRVNLVVEESADGFKARAVKDGEDVGDSLVLVCSRPGYELLLKMPMGQVQEGDSKRRWLEFTRDVAVECIHDWRNVEDQDGDPVEFDASYVTDGTLDYEITAAAVTALLEGRRKAVPPADSVTSQNGNLASGEPTAAYPTAEVAGGSEEKPA